MTWNLHPFLMTTGLIYFLGQGMLVYRSDLKYTQFLTWQTVMIISLGPGHAVGESTQSSSTQCFTFSPSPALLLASSLSGTSRVSEPILSRISTVSTPGLGWELWDCLHFRWQKNTDMSHHKNNCQFCVTAVGGPVQFFGVAGLWERNCKVQGGPRANPRHHGHCNIHHGLGYCNMWPHGESIPQLQVRDKNHRLQTILTSMIKYKLHLLAGAFRCHSGECALQCGCERPTIPQCHLWHDGSPGHPDASYPLVSKIQIQDTNCLKVKINNSFCIVHC